MKTSKPSAVYPTNVMRVPSGETSGHSPPLLTTVSRRPCDFGLLRSKSRRLNVPSRSIAATIDCPSGVHVGVTMLAYSSDATTRTA